MGHLRLVGTEAEPHAPCTPAISTIHPPTTEEASARLAHELSNLLDGSLRNVCIALAKLGDVPLGDVAADTTSQRLRTATESMRRMALLLRRWMSGGGEDVTRLYWQDATLADAVRYAVQMIDPICEAQGISLDVQIPPDLAAVPAGPMYPVIANGLRNAVEAIERSGTVGIRGWLIGDEAKLEIVDTGPGVAAFLPRDADGLVAPGATTKASGHGLGLAVSRQIVNTLNGSIKLDSGPHGGAVLSVQWNIRAVKREDPFHDR